LKNDLPQDARGRAEDIREAAIQDGRERVKKLFQAPDDTQFESVSMDDSRVSGMDSGTRMPSESREVTPNGTSLSQEDISGDLNFKGRESLEGIELASDHLWDITLEPFKYNGVGYMPEYNKKVNEVQNGKSRAENPEKDIDHIPFLSYRLDHKTMGNKEVPMYKGATIQIPETNLVNSQLTTQVLETSNRRWFDYFNACAEAMYDEESNAVLPYKNCCHLMRIYTYRPDKKVIWERNLLVLLKNFIVAETGTSDASPVSIDLEFSVVGDLD
jgi:hypothetical protein